MTLQQPPLYPFEAVFMAAKSWISPAEAGLIIRRARERVTLTQDQVAEQLNVDKSYISKLEGGQHHAGRSKYFPQLVDVLRLSEDEVRELNPSAVVGVHSPAPDSPISRPQLRTLPDTLQEAIDLYGKRYAELLDPTWQQYLAGFRWRQGMPTEPEAWLDLYRDLTRAGVVPGEVN